MGSNLSLSSSSLDSEKVVDQEPPSLPPRIQEKIDSSSSSSDSEEEDEDDGKIDVPKQEEEHVEESEGEEANNAVESSLVIETEGCGSESVAKSDDDGDEDNCSGGE